MKKPVQMRSRAGRVGARIAVLILPLGALAISAAFPMVGRAATVASKTTAGGPFLAHSGQPALPYGASSLLPGVHMVSVPGSKEGSIDGAVLDAADIGLPGACVQASSSSSKKPERTVSGAHGAYRFSRLAAGTYRLEVLRCNTSVVLAGGEVRLAAGHLAVLADLHLRLAGESFQKAEAALRPASTSRTSGPAQTSGSISGTVTSAGGSGLSGICVSVTSYLTGTTSSLTTGSTGAYSATLPAGEYQLSFAPGCGNTGNYAIQYYPDSAYPEGIQPVAVASGATTSNINAVLQPGGSISGAVEDASGTGLSGICVSDLLGGASTVTGSGGTYTLPDLAAGGVIVGFGPSSGPGCGTNSAYSGSIYPGPVAVEPGTTTSNIDSVLVPGGSISGTVTDEAGTGLAGVCVAALGVSGVAGQPGVLGSGSVATASDGSYTLTGLSTGQYQVSFAPGCTGATGSSYAYMLYQQGATVSVTAPNSTSGIDVVLQQGGSISGTATTGAGSAAGICIDAVSQVGQGTIGFAVTSSSGAYSISGMPAGIYQVSFAPGCGGTASLIGIQLSDVAVTDQQTTAGVSATLGAAGSISGTVTVSGGAAAEGVCVIAMGTAVSNSNIFQSATTAADGSYTVLGLPAGTYNVEFTNGCGSSVQYVTQYYNDQASLNTASTVTVSGTSDTPAIDAAMQPGGAISGTVIDPSGNAVPGLCAEAFSATSMAGQATTGADGSYTITGLASGSYNVQFADAGCGNYGGYLAQWYDNQPITTGTPQSVAVTAGQTTPGIGDTMAAITGSISGVVTDASGNALAGICVVATGNVTNGNIASTYTNGSYTITGLAADTFSVEFLGNGCGSTGNYAPQYYDNQPFAAGTPTSLTLAAGQAATGIDAALTAGGGISGTVTDASGNALAGICVSATGNNYFFTADGQTGAGGTYTLVGLPADSYYVSFTTGCGNNGPYVAQYYDNTSVFGNATLVPVTAGSTATGIDDALQYLYSVGSISGTVTSGSSGVGGICVDLLDSGGAVVASTVTAADGSYQIGLQPVGSYSVAFSIGCGNLGNYYTEFYGNVPAYPGSSVNVSAGANSPGINASLTAVSGSSSGTPGAPGTPSGVAEPSAVSLSWSAPGSSGSSAVSGYVVTPYVGPTAEPALQTGSSGTTYTVTGLTDGTAYTFTVAAENASGTGPASSSSGAVTPVAPAPATYNPLTPYRVCDTRPGNPSGLSGLDFSQCEGQTLGKQSTLTIQVGGTNPSGQTSGGVPAGATSVILNVTVTDTTAPSFLTVYPTGGARPLSSSVNWVGGQTVPNLVTVALGTGGDVSLYNDAGNTDVIVDVEGWMDSTDSSGGPYVPLTPYRICDTRPPILTPTNQCTGKTLGTRSTLNVQVNGTVPLSGGGTGVPSTGVLAVDLTVTVTDTTAPSDLTVWPAGEVMPVASNLNFVAGETVANNVVVAVPQSGPDAGMVSIYNDAGSTDVVVDVSGYYATTLVTGGALFTPMVPYRICDTRPTSSSGLTDACTGDTLQGGTSLVLQVAGVGGIPAGATSVVLNVTVTDTSVADFLTIYPDGTTAPNSSNLNWVAGETVASGVTATLGANGALDFYIPHGTADLVVDVVGWEQ